MLLIDMRGFMTHKGVPDFPRAARCILKDYVNVSHFNVCIFYWSQIEWLDYLSINSVRTNGPTLCPLYGFHTLSV